MRIVYPAAGQTLGQLAAALLALARPGESIELDTGGLTHGFRVPDRLADAYENRPDDPDCPGQAPARPAKRR